MGVADGLGSVTEVITHLKEKTSKGVSWANVVGRKYVRMSPE